MLEFISNEALANLATFHDQLRFPLTQVANGATFLMPTSMHLPVKLPTGLHDTASPGSTPQGNGATPTAGATQMQWILTPPQKRHKGEKKVKWPVNVPERFVFPRGTRLDLLETLVRLTAAVEQAGWSIPTAFARPQDLELTLAAGAGLIDLTLHHGLASTPLYAEVTRAHDPAAAARARAMLLDLCPIAR
ncbi:hypothetical protein [Hymenobacter lapidarius]|nr:hypothetical protein [Hymenobacter lapidarius]